MGMDISSQTIVGATYEDFASKIGDEKLDQMLDDGEIDYCSPYYDSPRDSWVVGIAVSDYDVTVEEFIEELQVTKEAFIKEFKFEPKVYSLQHVY